MSSLEKEGGCQFAYVPLLKQSRLSHTHTLLAYPERVTFAANFPSKRKTNECSRPV